MKAQFFDRQDPDNTLDGAIIDGPEDILEVLRSMHDRPPFVAELIGENGFKLTLGIGPTDGFVQFSPADGDPPYLMAVGPSQNSAEKEIEFLAGDTLTPVPRRQCLPFEVVEEIVVAFMEDGRRNADVGWEEV